MTTLVKRGTARRLGLRQPDRQWEHVGLFQFTMPLRPYVAPEWRLDFPASGPQWWLGGTRLG